MTPNELMSEKCAVERALADIRYTDESETGILLNPALEPVETSEYNFAERCQKIDELLVKERQIKKALNAFNVTAKIANYDMTISDALVYIGQINTELRALDRMARRRQISIEHNYNGVSTYYKLAYDAKEVKERMSKLQFLKTSIQHEVDVVNLTAEINY